MRFGPEFFFIIILLIWNGVLTFFFFKFYSYYSRLGKNGKKESISALLDDVLSRSHENKKIVDELTKRYDKLEQEGKLHIQKIGLVRFNPFKDTGGDQSFILALVDAEDSGVVISSLHTRTGTRWYAKRVTHGKGVEHALSDEEEEALRGARIVN